MSDDDWANHYLLALRRARNQRDVATLVQALQNPVEAARAARFLAQIGAREAVPEVQRLLGSPEQHIRIAAVDGLGKLGASESADDVTRVARTDPDQAVRSYALVALAQIVGPEARPTLCFAVRDDPDWRTRRAAAVALGLVGEERDLDVLAAAAMREHPWRRRRHRQARRQIMRRARQPR